MDEPIRVVIVREHGSFVAQCVDVDLTGHGETPTDAIDSLYNELIRHVLVARKFGRTPLAGMAGPPEHYLRLWKQAEQAGAPIQPFSLPAFRIEGQEGGDSALPRAIQYALVA